MKPKLLFVIVPFVAALLVAGLALWANHVKYYPKRVLRLPDGFINLHEATENANGVMKYIFFEEYISLVDIEGNSVGGSLVRNRKFIVSFQGEYYINAEDYYTALEKAKTVADIESPDAKLYCAEEFRPTQNSAPARSKIFRVSRCFIAMHQPEGTPLAFHGMTTQQRGGMGPEKRVRIAPLRLSLQNP